MTTTLTGYGGINEIGGSKLLLEDDGWRLFFDFGRPFGRYSSYFDGVFVKERTARGLLDLLALGLIPPLRGLLRQDLLPGLDPAYLNVTTVQPTGRQKTTRELVTLSPEGVDSFWQRWQQRLPGYRDLRRQHGLPVDAVLLSHAHQDHISDLVYVDGDVPAVSSRMTAFISKVLADVGMDGQGAPYSNPYVLDGNGSLGVERGSAYVGRPWYFVDGDLSPSATTDPLADATAFWTASAAATKGLEARSCALPSSLKIRSWPLDHSIFGATGYAVETSSGWIAYTGDLRMHGKHGRRSRAFAEDLAALRPRALLCEGTRLDQNNGATEEEVHDNCLRATHSAAGRYVVADFAPRNVERLETFVDIAAQTGRRLLVQPKDAYLLRALHLACPADIPDWMTHPHVALYSDPKTTMRSWENGVRQCFADRTVDHITVSKNPGDYILAFSLTDIVDLVDLHTMGDMTGGVYIFSNSAAYDDEQAVDLMRLWNWTRRLGLQVVGLKPPRPGAGRTPLLEPERGYHASGHAGKDDLADFVRTVHPQILVAVHTEQAHLWADLLAGTGIKIIIPQLYQTIIL